MTSQFLTDDEYNRGTVLIALLVWKRLLILLGKIRKSRKKNRLVAFNQ
jgi:hypothetical protein